ncbi:MAG: four helix bundle protein [Ginsengibacter sp.]|jgi:four helix bundle protein
MNVLKDKSFSLAIEIVKLYKYLIEEKREYVMSKQLLRSGTSVGAMVRESQNAESKMDFAHKLGIAQKECDETLYWLELIQATGFLNEPKFQDCYQHTSEVLKILKSVIVTTKQNLNKNKANQ